MLLGIMSDTHHIDEKIVELVVREFLEKKVDAIIHCGDIEPEHINGELFGNLPVVCALNREQCKHSFLFGKKLRPKFKAPQNWIFTVPEKRVLNFWGVIIYVGHKRSYEFLIGSEEKLIRFLQKIREVHDGLRWVFSGHTHQQFFTQAIGINRMVNPGAVSGGFDGHEYAIVDTKTDQVTFSRVLRSVPDVPKFSVGVISDSGKISKKDPLFWKLFAEEMERREIKNIIHCGGVSLDDIGKPELKDFSVYFNLVNDQKLKKETPSNWHLIIQDSLVPIGGFHFYIKWDLGLKFMEKSEVEMNKYCLTLKAKHPELDFVLSGLTENGLFVEGEPIKIFNPGDAENDRNFGVITLPQGEITIGSIPYKGEV